MFDLGTKMKIANLNKQREYITTALLLASTNGYDGYPTCRYLGTIYQENIDFFAKEGINIKLLEKEHGEHQLPLYGVYPKDVELTPEELEAAEKVEVKPEGTRPTIPGIKVVGMGPFNRENLPDFLKDLIGISDEVEDEDSEDSEENFDPVAFKEDYVD